MGDVFSAEDITTSRQVAIKVLSPALARDDAFRDRFLAEIESLKKLKHPGIVEIFSHGQQDGYLYYAMELVDGHSLEDELCAGRRFDWREITSIAIQLCHALKHAHDHGVIHRDLKPANVLLRDDGTVKLVDFGIARLFGGNHVTVAGGVLGTANYMSPEQADGRGLTERCDQYALGCLLYALATGSPPFDAKTQAELLQLHRYADPEPVGQQAPDLPLHLRRIIMQLLEKDPQQRFPNMWVLSRQLRAMQQALARPIVRPDAADPAAPPLLAAEGELDDTLAANPHPVAREERRERAVAVGATPLLSENRHTEVAQDSRSSLAGEAETRSGQWPQVLALVAALAGLVAVGWYFWQPPNADSLYAEISAYDQRRSLENLTRIEPQIEEFLARFPDDRRAPYVAIFQEDLELERAERRLLVQGRGLGQRRVRAPIERLYVEVVRLSHIHPELALERLKHILNAFNPDELSPFDRQCYELAQRMSVRLVTEIELERGHVRQLLDDRLERANELAAQDPQEARQILESMIFLYRDDPSSRPRVEQARQMLGTLSQQSDAPPATTSDDEAADLLPAEISAEEAVAQPEAAEETEPSAASVDTSQATPTVRP